MKKTLLYMLMIPVLVIVLSGPARAGRGQSGEELFIKSNQAFNEARYSEAVQGYEQLIGSGYASGHLYYNLGNAYFKMNRLGKAILNYERAKVMLPRDADLSFNLAYAQDRRVDAVSPPGQMISSIFFWLNSFNAPELFWIFVVFHIVIIAVLIVRMMVRNDWSYYIFIAVLLFWFVSGLSLGLKFYVTASDDRGVVTAGLSEVLAGPQSGDTVLFRLHEGTVVRQERFEPDWRLISLPDGKRGWMRDADVMSIMDARLRQKLMPF